jgi:hypothetical protein
MTQTHVRSLAGRRAQLASLVTASTLLAGCASMRTAPAPRNGAACSGAIARAHNALAAAPSAPGAYAAHAAAMHEYHACLAMESRTAGERANSTGDARER